MKIKLITTVAIFLLLSMSAKANSLYAGIELQTNQIKYKDTSISGIAISADDYYDDNSTDLSFLIGYNLNDNVAIELNYTNITTSKANNNTGLVSLPSNDPITTNITADFNIFDIDFIRNVEISKKAKLFGIGGIKIIKAEFEEQYNVIDNQKASELGCGLNLGFGIQYELTENLDVRIKARYSFVSGLDSSNLNGHNGIDNIVTFGTGLIYKF